MNRTSSKAMTLLELMVALFLVVIIIGLVMQIYIRTMRMRGRVEEVTHFNSVARASMGIIRRDLQGAFHITSSLPDRGAPSSQPVYGTFGSGTEVRWYAPVSGNGFRLMMFPSATDGGRLPFEFWNANEHAILTLGARAGGLFRQASTLTMMIVETKDLPPGWVADATTTIEAGKQVYADSTTDVFVDIGTYEGASYYKTLLSQSDSTTTPAAGTTIKFKYGQILKGDLVFENGMTTVTGTDIDFTADLRVGDEIRLFAHDITHWTKIGSIVSSSELTLESPYPGPNGSGYGIVRRPFPVSVVVGMKDGREAEGATYPLPKWMEDFSPTNDLLTTSAGTTFRMHAKECHDGVVELGPNAGPLGHMYTVIIQPLWFVLEGGIDNIVFRPDYVPTPSALGNWFEGRVPVYVDVILTIVDPDHPLGQRRFQQRIYLPTSG